MSSTEAIVLCFEWGLDCWLIYLMPMTRHIAQYLYGSSGSQYLAIT